MFIDPDGLVNLGSLLLSPGYSVDIIARSIDSFFGERLEHVLSLTDARLQLRCVLSFSPKRKEHQGFIESMQEQGWYFRILENTVSADTIIGDGEYVVVSATPLHYDNDDLVHYSDDPDYCSKVQQHFNYIWEQSAEILFEDLFASSIPAIERRILTLSTGYWDSLLDELIHNPHSIFEITPRKFEEIVAEMLIRDGFSVTMTPETRDGGRDILVSNSNTLGEHFYLVECKRYGPERPIGVSLVRALYGVVEAERASAGLLVTTSYFTKDAIKFRDTIQHRMSFRDYEKLVKWIRSFR